LEGDVSRTVKLRELQLREMQLQEMRHREMRHRGLSHPATQPPSEGDCRRGDDGQDPPSVRLGAEHAPPLLASLSVIRSKRALFAVDTYFRDSWEDLCELPPDGIEPILRHHALLLLKPDAVVGRRLDAALAWLGEQGTVVAAEPVRLDRHTARAMWQYQWNVASRDRRDLADLIAHGGGEHGRGEHGLGEHGRGEHPGGELGGNALVLIVRMPADVRPATVRLSAAKGPADPERREPWQLRHRLGNDNFLLNFVHTADEPADLVREIGVLFDAAERRRLYRHLLRGADATGTAQARIAELYERSPERDLTLAGLISRQYQRLDSRSGPAVRELAAALAATDAGLNADWRGLCDLAERAEVPLDRWDQVVLGTHLMVASEPGTAPILAGVPALEWDRRRDPAILPLAWVAPGRPITGTRREPGPAALETGASAPPMTAAPAFATPAFATPALSYDRPVPHQLVHKAGIDEVLVTDSAQVGDGRFVLAGELPVTHCYFSDLPAAGARFDVMALLELCRQAAYVVIHRHLRVPADRSFLLRSIGAEVAPEMVLADQPRRLRVAMTFEIVRHFAGSDAGLSAALTFATDDGRRVGTAGLSASWSPADEYARMRAAVRAAQGLSDRVGRPPAVRAPLATPESVGRTAWRNVLLAGCVSGTEPTNKEPTNKEPASTEPTSTEPAGTEPSAEPTGGEFRSGTGEFGAVLAVDESYRGMFNHPHDHLPGMLLMEAGRQAAVSTAARNTGVPAGALVLSSLNATFPAFAELDLPVHCVGTTGLSDPSGTDIRVSMSQGGARHGAEQGGVEQGGVEQGGVEQDGVEVCRIDARVVVDPVPAVDPPGRER
jgi:hypothetical protein